MRGPLQEGETLALTDGSIGIDGQRHVRVGEQLGPEPPGADAAFFEVDGPHLADTQVLKWFTQPSPIALRAKLEALIERASPNRQFIWPTDIAFRRDDMALISGVGYLMAKVPDFFVSSGQVSSGRIELGLSQLARAAFEVANAFLDVHAAGLHFREFSFGNVFVDVETGSIRMCDNDRLGVDGIDEPPPHQFDTGINAVAWFTAPEVLRQEELPSPRTDLHALAVMLFYLLVGGHPLDGRLAQFCPFFDERALVDLFGRGQMLGRPVFVFDPKNDSNRPENIVQDVMYDLWAIYPAFIKDLFTETFTIGLADPEGRARPSVWREAMVRLEANLSLCSTCGCEVFVDGPQACWNCTSAVVAPARLMVGDLEIMLGPNRVVRSDQVDLGRAIDGICAEVTESPTRPGEPALYNRSGATWTATHPTTGQHSVPAGTSVALDDGLELSFGPVSGVVRI